MTAYIDNYVVEQNLAHGTWTPGTTLVTVASGTLAMTNASTSVQIFSGSTAGQIVKLPDATTLAVGWTHVFHNDATVSVAVQDGAAGALVTIQPGQRIWLRNTSIAAAAGAWSYAVTDKSSLKIKAGVVAFGSFAGSPKKAAVVFTTAFADTNYSINITPGDARIVTYESKLATGFTINLNANQAPTAAVQWECIYVGET